MNNFNENANENPGNVSNVSNDIQSVIKHSLNDFIENDLM